jgi:hypothetical protein
MPMVTGDFGKLLWPGLNAIYGHEYDEFDVIHNQIFPTYTSRKAFEEDVGLTSFGLASQKSEGGGIIYDTEKQGFITRYTHVEYALGFIITRNMVEDDQYDVVGERRTRGLAFSMRQTKEVVAHNILNRAFTAAYAGGDGKEMLATDHPNVTGGTWANELTTAANLSEDALEQACIDLMKFTNDRGLRINAMPDTLILPVDLKFEAARILQSDGRVGTADNDTNALKYFGKFKKIVVSPYLTSATAWFIKTNVKDGLKHFERRADEFKQDNDFDTDNAKYKAQARYSFGWTDPRGMFGSPGV